MRLEPLYRVRFIYPEGWAIDITGEQGSEGQHLYFAEGSVEGRISGRFRASNFPHRRTDNTFMPHFHGVIQTDDDAASLFEYHGYGRAYPTNRRQWVVAAIHLSEDPRYRWLNAVAGLLRRVEVSSERYWWKLLGSPSNIVRIGRGSLSGSVHVLANTRPLLPSPASCWWPSGTCSANTVQISMGGVQAVARSLLHWTARCGTTPGKPRSQAALLRHYLDQLGLGADREGGTT